MKPKIFLAKSIATLLATITLTSALHALPQGEQVRAGTAAFNRTGAALDIRTSDRAIINYQSFSIGAAERVNFIQPGAQSITLNRVTAPNPSQIFGTLTSNGRIVLANPYGIFFQSGSVVNVGSLIAGAGHISDSDFLAGRINFSSLSGDVENRGSITAITDVALYGEHVSNSGSITSQKGSVTLAAGSSVYVGEAGGNIFVGSAAAIPKARVVSRPGVSNSGTISAPKATLVAGDMYGIAIAQSGNIVSGDITITAGTGGSVDVSGRLDASNRAPGKSGGKIKIKGDAIAVHDATLDASGKAGGGTIILDGGHNAVKPTTVTSSGTITARGEGSGAKGGTVQMLGDHVGLLGSAVVDVSGDGGGGTALVGGDYQGKNPDIQNAARTYISLDAQIHADAISSGDGGKVVIWSDDITRFYGTITSKGGAQNGNGGFVEVSGKHFLDYDANVNLTAPHGLTGNLLLDPTEITIQSGLVATDVNISIAGVGPFTDTSSGAGSILKDGTINAQLAVANVTVTTSVSDIVISNVSGTVLLGPVAANASTLTLNSAANISWNAAWTYTNTGQLNLHAAGGTISGTAGALVTIGGASPVMMQATAGIGSAGTPVLTSGLGGFAATTVTGGIFLTNTGNLTVTSLTNPVTTLLVSGVSTTTASPSGSIRLIETAGNLTVSGNITTNSGTVTLAASAVDKSIISTTNAISSAAGGGAAVTLQADNMSLVGGTITAGTGLVTLKATSADDKIQVGLTAADATGAGTRTLGLTGVELQTITGTGGITIGDVANTGGITVVGAVTGANLASLTGGTLTLQSNSGAIAVNATLTSPVNTTLTTASGNITFGAAGRVDAGANTVNLTATAGNIQGNAAAFNNVNAGILNLTASSGIGVANAIESTVGVLTFTNTTNAVQVTNTLAGGVTVSGTNAGTGAVNLTETAGALTVGAGDINTNGGAVTLFASALNKAITSAVGSDIITTGGGGNGAVTLQADNMSLAGALTSGTALVTLKPTTNATAIQVGAGATDAAGVLGLTGVELNTITTTGGITVGDTANTGGIVIVGNANPTGLTGSGGSFSLTTGGAITRTGGTLGTSGTAVDLSLNAKTGIGVLGTPIVIGTVTGSLSAINGPTSGNIALSTGAITLGGVAAVIDEKVAGGTIMVTSSANITIGGNLSVSGVGASTITLNATGTILDGTAGAAASGTLTAATINLGTTSATAVGAAGDPIATATANLNAKSSAGAVVVTNNFAGLTNLSAQAAGGLVNIANTNAGGSLATAAAIMSDVSSVTVSSSGNMSIGHAITGPTGVSLTVSGAENTLTHTAGLIDGTNAAITLTADKMVLTLGTIGNAIGDSVTLKGSVAGNAINLGSAVDTTANTLELSNTELNTITGALTIGSTATTGAITVSSAVNAAGATGGLTLVNNTGGIAVNASLAGFGGLVPVVLTANGGAAIAGAITGNGAISATTLTANAATGITLSGASTVLVVTLTNTTSGAISYTGSTVGVGNTLTVIGSNTATGAGNNFTLTESTGALTVGAGNISTKGGAVNLITQKLGGLLTLTGNVDTTAGGSPGGANVLLRGDVVVLTGTVNAGTSGNVVLRPNNTAAVIGVEDVLQIFNVTNLMLGQITISGGTITIGDALHTGNISVARLAAINQGGKNITLINQGAATANIAITGNNDFTAKNLTLSAGGAITQAAGTGKLVTQNAGDLTLTATKGIGTLANPILIGSVAGNLSADNSTGATAGDLSLQTGTITIGGGTSSLLERSTGKIQINATNAATDSLTIGGSVVAPGVGGAIILNAGTLGTITRTAGTLTAETVSLGTTSAMAVGAGGTPIITATANLNAKSSAGAIVLSNTLAGPTNVVANATGGLVNIANSLGTLTVIAAGGGVTSTSGAVTMTNVGNGITVNDVVTAGGVGLASLTSTGLTNASTITGPGGVTIDAGTGTLTNVAGTITNGGGVTATAVTLTADKMVLGATANAIRGGAGIVTLQQKTIGKAIDLGSAVDTNAALELSNAELGTVATTGALRVGNASSGAISITVAGINPAGVAVTRLTSGAGITTTGAGTFTGGSLALVAGGAINVTTAVTNLAASTAGVGITVSNTTAATLNVTTVDTIIGMNSTGTAISLTETTGAVTLAQAVNAGAGTVAVTLNGANKLLTNNAAVTGTGAGGVTFIADNMDLGPGIGTISAGSGSVTLRPLSNGTAIEIGAGVPADAAGFLRLSNAELLTITTSGTLTIGSATGTGGITVVAAGLDLTTGTFTGPVSLLQSNTGDIAVSGPLKTPKDLLIAGRAIAVNNTITTTNAGVVTFTNAGLLTINGNITSDGTVTQNGAGAVTVTGTRTITTTADAVAFVTGVTLAGGAFAIDTTNAGGSPLGSNILFSSTLTGTTAGAENLTLTGGTGDITFSNTVGVPVRLGAVLVNSAANVNLNNTFTAASLVQIAGSGTTTIAAAGTGVNTSTATGVNIAANTIAVNNTITTTGAGIVTLNATTGALTIAAAGDIFANGAVNLTATGGISTAGDVTVNAAGAPVNYNSPVTLTGNVVVLSTGSGNITFNSTVNGLFSLEANTGGNEVFNGRVGNTAVLVSLMTDASNLGGFAVFNAAGTTGAPSVITSGLQTYNDDVTLGANVVMQSTGSGNITFGKTVNGLFSLEANTGGSEIFNGRVGNTAALVSLMTDASNLGGFAVFNAAGTTGAPSVITSGLQTYNDDVTLGANVVLQSTGSGNITFGKTVNGLFSLEANTGGNEIFNGRVGNTAALVSLITDASNLGGFAVFNAAGTTGAPSVITSGLQTYNDDVTLGANVVLQSTGSGFITFNRTVNSDAIITPRALEVNTGGDTLFGNGGADYVGGNAQLLSLITDAGGRTILDITPSALPTQLSVTTQTTQNYGDNVVLNQATVLNGTAFNFAGTVMGGGNDLTIRANPGNLNVQSTIAAGSTDLAGADVTFAGPVSGVGALNIGPRTLGGGSGSLGGSNAIVPIVAASCILLSNDVTTVGGQTYQDCVKLLNNVTLISTANGNIQFNSTVDSFDPTPRALTVNTGGVTGFGNGVGDDRVGGMNALLSLTTDDDALAVNGVGGERTVFNVDPTVAGFASTVLTTGPQTYNDALTLTQDTVLTSTGLGALGNIAFASTVDTSAGALAERALTVNTAGSTLFGDGGADNVGLARALASVTTDAGVGSTVFNILGGAQSVLTTGPQTYNDAVTLTQDTVLSSTGLGALGNIAFASTVDTSAAALANRALTVNTAGSTLFGDGGADNVGLARALASLTTDAGAGSTVFNILGGAQSVLTTGPQTYNDAVVLTLDTVLRSTGAGVLGNIQFNSTVDSFNATPRALAVNTGGVTGFGNGLGDDRVGGTNALLSLTTDDNAAAVNGLAGERTVFNVDPMVAGFASTVRTTGRQTYNDAVGLMLDTVLQSTGVGALGNIQFNSTVDTQTALPGIPRALTVNTGGVTGFGNGVAVGGNRVGGTNALFSLTTDAGGSTVFNVPRVTQATVTTTLGQTYNDAVTLTQDTLLLSTAGGDIKLLSTVQANSHALQLVTGGNATLGATISNLTALFPQVTGTTTIGTDGAPDVTFIQVPTALTFSGPVAIAGFVNIATTTPGVTPEDGDIQNTGAALRFSQTVIGTGSLTASAGGELTFAGDVVLKSLTASAPIIRLRNVTTQGLLKADATIAGTSDGSDGLVILTGNSYTSSGGSVELNPSDRARVSKHATILSTDGNVTIFALNGSFTMGNEQKLLVNNGSLTINVGGTATVGDMAAFTSIKLTAGAVILQGRALNGFFNSNRKDGGLGFVSPTISFSTSSIAFRSGTNQKTVFSTRDSIASVRQIAGLSLQIDKDIANQFSKEDLKVNSQFQPVDPKVKYGTVQPIASGTRVAEPGQIQVVFVLEIPKLVELPENTFLSRSDQDVLKKMGIYPREATDDENITVSLRQGVFRQPIEGTPQSQMEDPDYKVVVNRLTTDEVKEILRAYKAVAGEKFENLQKIATLLGEQVAKFQVATPGALGLDGFTKWLQAQREKDKPADELAKNLDELASVFVRLARIGLTKKEVMICKATICDQLREFLPGNVEVWDVIPLIEGGANPPIQAPRPAVTAPPADAPPAVAPPTEGAPTPPSPAALPPPPESPATPPTGAAVTPAAAPLPPAPDASAPPKAQ